MHSKYAKDGFEVVAVNIDDPSDTKTRDRVGQFLTEKVKAPFTTVNLDPKSADLEKKLKANSTVPVAYVFNRDNLYVKKLPVYDAKGDEVEEVDYAVIEAIVAKLLNR